MAVKTFDMHLSTKGFGDMIDVTQQVQDLVKKSRLTEGIATVFIPGSTAAVTTVEYESGAVSDLKDAFDRLVPTDMTYAHNERWGDGNGFSHVRSALLKTSLTIPFTGGNLMLGRWQQVTVVDFDNGTRDRRVIVQVMGE
ncbi:MAG: secondary thiamine-phosphate synthase enzyme YjbQ [Candidatus Eisenbacteria bacterium]